ncbi:sigma-70 family RNA polymerase sigma factor [Hoylesella timonensis]|uniref:sigma-70 family RNA polymerase sigma factor n=1 Tax=Hoylesella timonensis TaxID=386414 RepID=UPI003369F8E6
MKHFKIYFDLYYRSLCIYATHLLNDTNLVEDVVMECYIGLWIKLKGGAQISEVKNYLFISVRNACYDVNRRSKMIANFVNTDQIEDILFDEDDENKVEREAELWQAIDSLPQKCRKIFLMSKQEELSHVEIANQLGLSIKTVESQIRNAYKKLRDKIGKI